MNVVWNADLCSHSDSTIQIQIHFDEFITGEG